MNPRYRRLLIPGLLVALLVVALVAGLVKGADGATGGGEVSRIVDPRVTESSGLAVSRSHEDLAYTINDSGHEPVVYAVRVTTGRVVGATRVTGAAILDPEALALDGQGQLWIADTGDNRRRRAEAALVVIPEPGPGDREVRGVRHAISFAEGARDVEALAIDPRSGRAVLISKGLLAGQVYPLPPRWPSGVARLTPLGVRMPGMVTDATVADDGRVLVRTYTHVHAYDGATWERVSSHALPPQPQGETIAIDADGRSFLVGSEGPSSALIRVPYVPARSATSPAVASPAVASPAPTDEPTDEPRASSATPSGSGFAGATWAWAVLVLGLLAAVAAAASRRR